MTAIGNKMCVWTLGLAIVGLKLNKYDFLSPNWQSIDSSFADQKSFFTKHIRII